MSQRLILLLLLLIAGLMRLPSLYYPYMNIDEVMWGMHAKAIVDGFMPYVHVMGEKPPLLYLCFAGIFWLFGAHNYFAVHLISMVWAALTGFVLYRVLRQCDAPRAGIVAGCAYVLASSVPGFRMSGTSGELIMNLPLTCSVWAFVVGVQRRKILLFGLAGVLVICAGLVRQQAMIHFGAFGVVGLLLLWRPLAGFGRKACLQGCFAMACGACLGLLGTFWYVITYSVWDEFVAWTMQHNVAYIQSGFFSRNVLVNFSWRTSYVVLMTFPLWILAALRVRDLWRTRTRWATALPEWLFVAWAVVALMATTPGGRFYPHYFLQAYPPLCLLAALALIDRWPDGLRWPSRRWTRMLICWLVMVVAGKAVIPLERQLGTNGDYSPAVPIVADYLQRHTAQGETIFVWGWAAGLYMFAERDPATRLISVDFLTGRSPSQHDARTDIRQQQATEGAWDKVFTDFAERNPTYIVDTSPGNYHGYRIYPMSAYPRLQAYVQAHFVLEQSLHGMDLYRRKKKTPPSLR